LEISREFMLLRNLLLKREVELKCMSLKMLAIGYVAFMYFLIKSIEPYSSTKGTLRKEICSRLIKPTTQVYLGNVGLLTLFSGDTHGLLCLVGVVNVSS
jgi:hypothetical protein